MASNSAVFVTLKRLALCLVAIGPCTKPHSELMRCVCSYSGCCLLWVPAGGGGCGGGIATIRLQWPPCHVRSEQRTVRCPCSYNRVLQVLHFIMQPCDPQQLRV